MEQLQQSFARCVGVLANPLADPAAVHTADAWLSDFRSSCESWAVAQALLSTQQAAELARLATPDVRLAAAQVLAWKAKRQLGSLQAAERSVLAQALAAAAVATAARREPLAARALCVALANCAIQCTDWEAPLRSLAPLLGRELLLEFLTALPQECEDAAAAAAAPASPAEAGFALRQRVRGWAREVGAWLVEEHCAVLAAAAGTGATQLMPGAGLEAAVLGGGESGAQATLRFLGCWTAWVKCGTLPYCPEQQAEHFLAVATALLLSGSEALVPAGVEAASEAVEHSMPLLEPLLLGLALRLARALRQLLPAADQLEWQQQQQQQQQDQELWHQAGHLSHVLCAFVSTHPALVAAAGPEAAQLREALLGLLLAQAGRQQAGLPGTPGQGSGAGEEAGEDGEEAGGSVVHPALAALSDLLEHLLQASRGLLEEQLLGGGDDGMVPDAPRCVAAVPLRQDVVPPLCRASGLPSLDSAALDPAACREFAARALHALLLLAAPRPEALQLRAGEPPPGGRSVPLDLRRQAELAADVCGDVLEGPALVRRLLESVQGAAVAQPVQGAAQALDAALWALQPNAASHVPPAEQEAWALGVLQLLLLVPRVDGSGSAAAVPCSPGQPAQAAPVTVLHYDLLTCCAALAPFLLSPLSLVRQAQGSDGPPALCFARLVVQQALRALSCPLHLRAPAVAPGATCDVIEASSVALRALCSAAATCRLPAAASHDLLSAVDQSLAMVEAQAAVAPPGWRRSGSGGGGGAYQGAAEQLVVALAHVLHGGAPDDQQLLQLAQAAMQRHVFARLEEALEQASAAVVDGSDAAAGGGGAVPASGLTADAAAKLTAALRRVQALLNALESYSDGLTSSVASHGSGPAGDLTAEGAALFGSSDAAPPQQQTVAQAGTAWAVGAFLAAWPPLSRACQALPCAGVFDELGASLSSCLALCPQACQATLPSFANTAAACFFLPGGAALHCPLCTAVETFGPLPQLQAPLLGTVAAVLSAPVAAPLAALRGGDARPDLVTALLALASACLRGAARWTDVAPNAASALLPLLEGALQLAVANAACYHRETSQVSQGGAAHVCVDAAVHGSLCQACKYPDCLTRRLLPPLHLAQRTMATLSCAIQLALEEGAPLQPVALAALASRGTALLQGMLLSLLSLPGGGNLPKLLSLVGDTALLAARYGQQQAAVPGNAASVAQAAGTMLRGWMEQARSGLVAAGTLSPEVAAALASQWDWSAAIEQAAAAVVQQRRSCHGAYPPSPGPGAQEVRRQMQRQLRQIAALVYDAQAQ